MSAFVVILRNDKLISVQKDWIKTPIVGQKSLVFVSPNKCDSPNFDLKISYFFHEQTPACYEARILEPFGEYS